jgi:glycosyltransferase involved in cell wall biosynthesis
MASVDIVVPCYRYAHFLEGCTHSILSQRGVEIRVLILDDASPDHTQQVGEKLAAADSRVSYLKNEQNLGLIGTANRGLLEWARADYVLLLSADDLLMPGSLARATAIMDEHPDVHMVYGQSLLIGDEFDLATIPLESAETQYKLIAGRDFIRRNFTHHNPVPSPTAVLRTSKQHELGGYLPQFPHTSDMEMWMRFAGRGPIGVIKNLQACYRIHEASMSTPRLTRAISDREECLETCTYVSETWCADIPEATDWLIELKRKLAKEAYWLANRTRYTSDQRVACAAFARRVDPDGPASLPRLKFEIKKRLLALRSRTELPETFERTGLDSKVYGWWPDEV